MYKCGVCGGNIIPKNNCIDNIWFVELICLQCGRPYNPIFREIPNEVKMQEDVKVINDVPDRSSLPRLLSPAFSEIAKGVKEIEKIPLYPPLPNGEIKEITEKIKKEKKEAASVPSAPPAVLIPPADEFGGYEQYTGRVMRRNENLVNLRGDGYLYCSTSIVNYFKNGEFVTLHYNQKTNKIGIRNIPAPAPGAYSIVHILKEKKGQIRVIGFLKWANITKKGMFPFTWDEELGIVEIDLNVKGEGK